MSTLAIQGCQWGDEGKGKITDYCASKADVVVRSQGGNNAGHSIVHQGQRYALRLLPSGIFNPRVVNVLSDGVVINPWGLLEEIDGVKKAGVTSFQLLKKSMASKKRGLPPFNFWFRTGHKSSCRTMSIWIMPANWP
jgi:Adenylosuccinate synthase